MDGVPRTSQTLSGLQPNIYYTLYLKHGCASPKYDLWSTIQTSAYAWRHQKTVYWGCKAPPDPEPATTQEEEEERKTFWRLLSLSLFRQDTSQLYSLRATLSTLPYSLPSIHDLPSVGSSSTRPDTACSGLPALFDSSWQFHMQSWQWTEHIFTSSQPVSKKLFHLLHTNSRLDVTPPAKFQDILNTHTCFAPTQVIIEAVVWTPLVVSAAVQGSLASYHLH